jgi:hypothetical protein
MLVGNRLLRVKILKSKAVFSHRCVEKAVGLSFGRMRSVVPFPLRSVAGVYEQEPITRGSQRSYSKFTGYQIRGSPLLTLDRIFLVSFCFVEGFIQLRAANSFASKPVSFSRHRLNFCATSQCLLSYSYFKLTLSCSICD